MNTENSEAKRPKWRQLLSQVSRAPKDNASLKQALADLKSAHPPPVLWLVGKTQSGKTSIIRYLTGSSDAEIGTGFTPCTRTTRLYDFPVETPLVRFLDTRGLGEVGYDSAEDLKTCEAQARSVIAVMKVTDVHQNDVYQLLAAVRRRHPAWPLILVQTCLHEAQPGAPHPQPYPFNQPDWELRVSDNLRRALLQQRVQFDKLPGHGALSWTPVDLTQPEDQLDPPDYGLAALWQAIERALGTDLHSLLYGDNKAGAEAMDETLRAVHPHIMGYAVAAAGAGALPVVDLALVPALQLKMLHTLAAIYQQPWNRERAGEFFALLGAGFLANYGLRWAGRSLVKLIPVWGQTAGVVWGAGSSAAITYALGRTASYYLASRRNNRPVNTAELRAIYHKALAHGKALLARTR